MKTIWSLVDPVGDVAVGLQGYGTDDAQLRFDIPAGVSHDLWVGRNYAPRLLQASENSDMFLEAKFDSVVSERYQIQGIVVQESFNHLIRFEVYHDGNFTHMFASVVTDTTSNVIGNVLADAEAVPNRIRVQRVGDTWTMSVAAEGEDFEFFTTFDHPMTIDQVGVHAGTHNSPESASPAFTAKVDYFFNAEAPIENEDGPVDTDPPVADAGVDQSAHPGDVVQLDGSGSADDWTAPEDLTFEWTLVSAPAGSGSVLSSSSSATPTLPVDALGDYALQLVVTDEAGLASEPADVLVSSLNSAPVAEAGTDAVIQVGEQTLLDGLGSTDLDLDPLEYSWQILMAPAGSTAVLAGADTATPSLCPDLAGDYTIELVVSDPYSDSVGDTVVITVGDPYQLAIQTLRDLSWEVRCSSYSDYRRWYYKHILRRQIRVVAREIQKGHLDMARFRLEFLIRRVDGCTLRGQPDGWSWFGGHRLDWVTSCSLQSSIYGSLDELLELLQ